MSEIKRDNEVKVGDTVWLKSGSPELTVSKVTVSGERATCTWYNSPKAAFQSGEFFTVCLSKRVKKD